MSDPPPLASLFLAHLRAPAAEETSLAELEEALQALWRDARAAWPDLVLPAADFLQHVAELVPEERGGLAAAVHALRGGDLYLACGCAAGLPEALRLFERHLLSQVPAFVARQGASPDQAEEVQQKLRERMLVATPAGPPKIAEYAGRGPLWAWVRVAAVRTAISLKRNRNERSAGQEDRDMQALPSGADPELDYLKDRYRQEFGEAFQAAFQELTSDQRTLLRMHIVDGLSTEKLAAVHRVHRVTVTRWLATAREALFDGTRRLLHERLRLAPGEFESLLRLVRSRLDVSIRGLLRPDG